MEAGHFSNPWLITCTCSFLLPRDAQLPSLLWAATTAGWFEFGREICLRKTLQAYPYITCLHAEVTLCILLQLCHPTTHWLGHYFQHIHAYGLLHATIVFSTVHQGRIWPATSSTAILCLAAAAHLHKLLSPAGNMYTQDENRSRDLLALQTIQLNIKKK